MKGENKNYSHMHGGPGSSNKNDEKSTASSVKYSNPDNNTGQDKNGMERNIHHSSKSGGGGEQDSHHTHNAKLK